MGLYKDVQARYWDVSLFRYWKLTNLHMFLMAAPAFYLCLRGVFSVFAATLAGHIDTTTARPFSASLRMLWSLRGYPFSIIVNNIILVVKSGASTCHLIPLAAHALLVMLICLTTANVQIVTRMLASSSVFFAIVLGDSDTRLTRFYALAYALCGSVLFPA